MARLGRGQPFKPLVQRYRIVGAGPTFLAAWAATANIRLGAMQKNVAGQTIGAQMISATDGSPFTGSVTAYVTGDAGTQAVGSVGSGACTHEGEGYHTYAPAQAETNYTLIAFTFKGTGAISQTVQVFTTGYDPTAAQIPANVTQFGGSNGTFSGGRPEVNTTHAAGTAWGSGAITAASIANGAIDAATFAADVDAEILSYLVDDATRIDASALNTLSGHDPGETIMGATDTVVLTDGSLTAAKIAADAITAAKLSADVTTELQSGLATTTHVQEVEDKVDILDTNVDTLLTRITSTLFSGITSLAEWLGLMAGKQTGNNTARTEIRATGAGSGTYDETTDALQAIRDRGDAAWTTATGFSTHSASDVWAVGTRSLTVIDEDSTTLDLDGTIRSAVGLASANLDTQLDALPTAAENATAAWAAGTRTLTAIDEDSTTLDLDATVRAAVGLASANLDTQLDALPTAGENADAVWDEATAGHTTGGTFGEQLKTDVDAILDDTGTSGVAVADKAGYRLSATGVDDILDEQIGDSTITLRQALKLAVATLGGKLSGAATATITIRNAADDTDVVVATVDGSGNRSAVTLSL